VKAERVSDFAQFLRWFFRSFILDSVIRCAGNGYIQFGPRRIRSSRQCLTAFLNDSRAE